MIPDTLTECGMHAISTPRSMAWRRPASTSSRPPPAPYTRTGLLVLADHNFADCASRPET